MQYRQLGRTGITVSEVGFGAWGIGGAMWQGGDDDAALAALAAALDAGCTFIDTALAYGNGHSERLIAKALAGRTGQVAVASKIPPKNQLWPARPGVRLADVFPADYVERCANVSAENLGRAVDLGYRDAMWIRKDADLESIRKDRRFKALMQRLMTSQDAAHRSA